MKTHLSVKSVLVLFLILFLSFDVFSQEKKLRKEDDGFKWIEVRQDGHYGAIRKKDNAILIPLDREYDLLYYTTTFGGGYFSVRKGGKAGACDKNGKEIMAPVKYDKVHYVQENKHNQFFYVYLNEKEGICDNNGKEIIAPKYDNVCCHYEKDGSYYYEVELNGKQGACDINGREIIAPMYETLIFSSLDNAFNYKDASNKWVSTGIQIDGTSLGLPLSSGVEQEMTYDGIERTLRTEKNGYKWYLTTQDSLFGAQNKDGKELIPPSYHGIVYAEYGFFWTLLDGKFGVCDINGKEIIEPGYYWNLTYYDDGSFKYQNSSGEIVDLGVKLDCKNNEQYASSISTNDKKSKKATRAEKWEKVFNVLGAISEACYAVSDALSGNDSEYNPSYSPSYDQGFYDGQNERNEEIRQKNEQIHQKNQKDIKQSEWMLKNGKQVEDTYSRYYERICDVKIKAPSVRNLNPSERAKQVRDAQRECKKLRQRYKENTGYDIPGPKELLDWHPTTEELSGN